MRRTVKLLPHRTKRLPNPTDCTRERQKYRELRCYLDEVRRRYAVLVWKRIRNWSRVEKRNAVLVIACKLKARGIYAESTYLRDVCWSLMRRFIQIEADLFGPLKLSSRMGRYGQYDALDLDDDWIVKHSRMTHTMKRRENWRQRAARLSRKESA